MRAFLCVVLVACAGSTKAKPQAGDRGPKAANEQIVDNGGKLRVDAVPAEPVRFFTDHIQLWAYAEAKTGTTSLDDLTQKAAAQARDDLGRFVEVALQHLDLRLQAAGQEGAKPQELAAVSQRVQSDIVQKLGQAEQAWQKVEREGDQFLRVFVRYSVLRAALKTAFENGLDGRPRKESIVEETISGLGK